MPETKKITLVIPTYNAANYIGTLFSAIFKQNLQPDQILVIDSSSKDATRELLSHYPLKVHTIAQQEFDHGGTRRLATELVDSDIYIFMTQDAIPADPDCFRNLVRMMTDDIEIGCAYGRQLPHHDANPVSIHARLFNYPDVTLIKQLADKEKYGVKTCFNSNSFSAYRKTALIKAGNFPAKLPMSEDMYVAAKMLQSGFKIAYVADACVHHSHNLSLSEEFHRYFFIGVFYAEQPWITLEFNSANKEGWRFVRSELSYLTQQRQFHWIPQAIASIFVKFFAYQLGLHHKIIPKKMKRHWGISRGYWNV